MATVNRMYRLYRFEFAYMGYTTYILESPRRQALDRYAQYWTERPSLEILMKSLTPLGPKVSM